MGQWYVFALVLLHRLLCDKGYSRPMKKPLPLGSKGSLPLTSGGKTQFRLEKLRQNGGRMIMVKLLLQLNS